MSSCKGRMSDHRLERDFLGERPVPRQALYGIHTLRAQDNFPLAGRPVHPQLIRAYGAVKLACARTNRALGCWADDPAKAEAIERACVELSEGQWLEHIGVDSLQGGAGTSTNMNVNEVLANRALALLGLEPGAYGRVSPLDDLNRHQSTNDTYPTALKLAAIRMFRLLESRVVALQEAFQAQEKRLAHVVKIGRTQLQDAALITLGREMGAYAEAVNRDRWRIYKCEERLRQINLGGTAIGTGLAAPRAFILRVVDNLREVTGIGFARAENLVDLTQNADLFVEVSGLLKAHAVTLFKICSDLRLLASGPEAGLGELRLPARQAGSSLMPGKVNPVIPEAVSQVALLTMGHDATLAMACAAGSLELNPFLPLVAHCLLDSLAQLTQADDILARLCVHGIEADIERCRQHVENSTATATALVPMLGYERACEIAKLSQTTGQGLRHCATQATPDNSTQSLTMDEYDALLQPEAVGRLGWGTTTPEAVR
jgi:aspartate ammonia-lyase